MDAKSFPPVQVCVCVCVPGCVPAPNEISKRLQVLKYIIYMVFEAECFYTDWQVSKEISNLEKDNKKPTARASYVLHCIMFLILE